MLISAVGPFRFLGRPVAEAAVEGGADLLDICGEPDYLERTAFELGPKASEAGVLAVSAAGFDSIPGDVGAQQAVKLLPSGALPNRVVSIVRIGGGPAGVGGHYATYESAIHGFAAAAELGALRKAAAARAKAEGEPRAPPVPGERPARLPQVSRLPGCPSARLVPFLGADASVIRRTVAFRAARGIAPPFYSSVSLALPSPKAFFMYSLAGWVFSFLAIRAWGRKLLLRFPRLFSFGFFSHRGPTELQIEQGRFAVVHVVKGYDGASSGAESSRGTERSEDASATPLLPAKAPAAGALTGPPTVTRALAIRGPEAGYVSCAIFVVAAAKTLLEERDAVLAATKGPGVFTPGEAFADVGLVDRIRERGVFWDEVPVDQVPEIVKAP